MKGGKGGGERGEISPSHTLYKKGLPPSFLRLPFLIFSILRIERERVSEREGERGRVFSKEGQAIGRRRTRSSALELWKEEEAQVEATAHVSTDLLQIPASALPYL